ncbi:MAG: insulinase family protein [Pyrinomonadaceae bacterium]
MELKTLNGSGLPLAPIRGSFDFSDFFRHFMNKSLSRSASPRTRAVLAVLSIVLAASSLPAQTPYFQEPARQQLLNGLQILVWQRPGDQDVLLKMRIHSGAAFDLAGKAGMMALLGDALFPDAETRQYFTDELGGRLEVVTDYDAITITMSGHARGFERMVEMLHNALVATPLSPENVAKLREARTKVLREASVLPSLVADRAIAARLFGEFPYGRPAAGSAESVSRIDRGDLMLARDRFLNADNATLVVIGSLDERRMMRTLRQLLGNWRKSDRAVPATFRQPEAPDLRPLIVNQPGFADAEVRLATRGLARADRDYVAASLLAVIARERWQAALPELSRSPIFARHEVHMLPGIFVLGATVKNANAAKAIVAAQAVIRSLVTTPPSAAEIERARNETNAEAIRQASQPGSVASLWLDAETFKLSSFAGSASSVRAVTPDDVKNVAMRLFKDNQIATVILGSYDEMKQNLSPLGKIEILGDPSSKSAPPAPAKTP